MKYTQYDKADSFLERMIHEFELNEPINGLMFGTCLQLKENVLFFGKQPLLAVVNDDALTHLAALMTPPYRMQLCSPGTFSKECIECLCHGLAHNGWSLPGVRAGEELAESFAETWSRVRGCGHEVKMEQLLYELRNVNPMDYSPGEMRQADSRDLEKAVDLSRRFYRECFGKVEPGEFIDLVKQRVMSGAVFFWEDSGPVTMAARTRPTPNGESISLVYTTRDYRGHGYATSIVASLSRRILDEGKHFCSLYADAANLTSNDIYRKIGYTPVNKVVDIDFEY